MPPPTDGLQKLKVLEVKQIKKLETEQGLEAQHVPLVEFMYLVFTRMPGESYHRQLRSLLLYLCYVCWALINFLVCRVWEVKVARFIFLSPSLADLKSQIARKMVEIDEVQRQVDTWTQFRDVGSHMQDTQIKILEQELKDMQNSFDEMSGKWQDWVVCQCVQAEPCFGAEWV